MPQITKLKYGNGDFQLKDLSAHAAIEQMDVDISGMQSQIDILLRGMGGATMASTVADLVDHDKLYVWIGATTPQYTQGHWIYWNGSAFVDSGLVYQAAELNIDDTLTLEGFAADAKAVGDRLDAFFITPAQFHAAGDGSTNDTSGTAGKLYFGGVPNSDKPKSYYTGIVSDAQVFLRTLSDAQVSMLMVGSDVSSHDPATPVYDISDEAEYVSGTGYTFDGTFAIDTDVPLLETTNDFTIISRFKFDKMRGENGQPNFSFFPVFSAMSADPPTGTPHTGNTDKGFDVGLSMQDGTDMNNRVVGGFINFRRDWRYNNWASIDSYNYSNYQNIWYTVIIQRKDNVIKLYDANLVAIATLTGDYATAIVNGNLTIGAQMGYGSGYTNFFKGTISDFRVYDVAVPLADIEAEFPSINDNDVSDKGAITYHLSNKTNKRKSVRYALVEINYDLGDFNDDDYTATYPKAFGVRLDKIYDDTYWVPCSAAKRVVFTKLCKWDAVCDPFEDWDIEIINPGTVPGMTLTVSGVKVLLLSKQEAVASTTAATEFNVSWEEDLTTLTAGDTVIGYVQFVPENADSGKTLTVSSDDTSVATVSATGQDITISAIATGETLIHVSIPYGTQHTYSIVVE